MGETERAVYKGADGFSVDPAGFAALHAVELFSVSLLWHSFESGCDSHAVRCTGSGAFRDGVKLCLGDGSRVLLASGAGDFLVVAAFVYRNSQAARGFMADGQAENSFCGDFLRVSFVFLGVLFPEKMGAAQLVSRLSGIAFAGISGIFSQKARGRTAGDVSGCGTGRRHLYAGRKWLYDDDRRRQQRRVESGRKPASADDESVG